MKALIKEGKQFKYYVNNCEEKIAKEGDELEGELAQAAINEGVAVKGAKKKDAPENKDQGNAPGDK